MYLYKSKVPVHTLHPRCFWNFTCNISQLNSARTHSISRKVRVGLVILKRVWDTYENDTLSIFFSAIECQCPNYIPGNGEGTGTRQSKKDESISMKNAFSTVSLPSGLGWALSLCSCKQHGKQHGRQNSYFTRISNSCIIWLAIALSPGTKGKRWH